MTQAINSGAINETKFPGSQDGLSLIELVGTAQVVCTISSLGLRLVSGASASGSAIASVGAVTLRRSESAVTTATANGSVAVRGRVQYSLAPQAASAVTQASITLRRGVASSESAVAATSAFAFVGIGLGASGQASADGSADTTVKALRGATTSASASGSAAALRAISRSASTTAAAITSVLTANQIFVSATVTARAIASSAATDFGITQRAPDERRMFVQAADRRMEVTL